MRLSNRLPWATESASPLLSLREERERRGEPVVSLVSTDPTSAGLDLPWGEVAAALADVEAWKRYRPDPHGAPAAREALVSFYARWGERVDAERIFVGASTSELYSWLFQTLGDPGDSVLVPEPGYPLFDEIAALAGVGTAPAPLVPRFSAKGELLRWAWEPERWNVPPKARALVVVAPHNPTGAVPTPEEWRRIGEFCARRGLCLVVDEVFRLLGPRADEPTCDWDALGVPVAVLSGLSKWLAAPQLKLAWMRLYGPEADLRAWNDALEHAADACLNVGGPAQAALPSLLPLVDRASAALAERVARNRGIFLEVFSDLAPKVRILSEPFGWYAVLALDADEERLTLDLLRETGLFVHPGFFYDFDEGTLVLALVADSEGLRAGFGLLRGWLEKNYL